MKKTFWDGRLQEDRLGGYVYALVDPRKNSVFYVGLAGGLEGQGNNRPDCHLIETANKKPSEELSPKQAKIKEIWDSGKEPELIIVRRNLTPDEAKHVEAALIDLLNNARCLDILTNVVRGHGVAKHSIVTAGNRAELCADPVQPTSEIRNVWLFNIQNALKEGKSPYEAVRGDWKINKHHLVDGESYAVGLKNGISVVVVKIVRWNDNGKRKSFHGEEVNMADELGQQLLEKSFSKILESVGNWNRGGSIKVNFLQPNKVEIVRGVKGGAEIEI